MNILSFVQGVALGFSIAMPVGPIGILCIQRTLTRGRIVGFVSGLGAATADGFYGLVAGFGLTAVSNGLLAYETWVQRLGGAFLIYLGVKAFLEKPRRDEAASSVGHPQDINQSTAAIADHAAPSELPSPGLPSSKQGPWGLLSAYTSTTLLTLTNPATILSFLAIFAGLGLARVSSSYMSAIALVGGVFLGSALWWLCLSVGVGLVRQRITPRIMRWLNRGSGILLTGFGLASIWFSWCGG